MFRLLKANEIECRVSTVSEKGLSLLLYKDARVDQNILDETVGAMNWQRKHTRDNHNCIVSLWDKEKGMWVEKEDTGTESYTEKEKGLASDSFKRACFNWGIGRELYTAPFIWVTSSNCEIKPKGQGYTSYDRFEVKNIGYDSDGNINALEIINSKSNKTVYTFGNTKVPKVEKIGLEQDLASVEGINENMVKSIKMRIANWCEVHSQEPKDVMAKMLKAYKLKSLEEVNLNQFNEIMKKLEVK